MKNGKIDDFCTWWRSLTPTDLPQPSASATEEHKHQHYYVFANELTRRWSDSGAEFQKLYAADKAKVLSAVEDASDELVAWFDDVARPTLNRILDGLGSKDDLLLQVFGDADGPFGKRALEWLDNLRSTSGSAAKSLMERPPYLTLGAQAGRPETRLRRSTGVWTTNDLLGNWPWRDFLVVRDSLNELRDFGDDYPRAMELLTTHCEGPWLEALRKIPASSASVQSVVAGNCWTAVHVLNLVLHPIEGTLTRDAYDWAQQLTAPFQPWYESHGGLDDRLPDENGVLIVYPVKSLNSAFVRPDPRVTYFASSHVRYPCLFLRFLVDRIVVGVEGALRTADHASKHDEPLGARVRAATIADCVMEPFWGERNWCVDLGNRNAPSQRVIPGIPKPVVRVLKAVGAIQRGADEPPTVLKHDDPTRFRKWFSRVFDVAEPGNPLARSPGGFVPGWHTPKRNRV